MRGACRFKIKLRIVRVKPERVVGRMNVLNYEVLLKKYIDHVRSCEGTDFVSDAKKPEFSAQEVEALNRLADEVDVEWRKVRGG